ncbi:MULTISPECIES: hypothetical protein [Enterococcus]|uniref:hypothetical protein n=1 Tax=Enterococcus TaxID=1350 RepID=UPI001C8CEC62|nr:MULTISPECIES: hypothetical protein [Enterococcus]MBS6069799.1 hypothetical protein [Enterococcus avium]MBX9121903.1 hypothetical protein [Enterococcus sp. K18_3]MCO5513705.1 hypothetical protein [Enterococcus faecalis]MCO5519172.1 hypothetical protein [Enterococcus faecalis]
MNNRRRRVERLRRKYETPAERRARDIIAAMMKVGQTMGQIAKVLKRNQEMINQAADKSVIEQMCRPGKVELEDFEKLTEVAE